MRSKNPLHHLDLILERIEAIEGFAAGSSRARFAADLRSLYATVYALQGISEAVRQLPDEMLARHPQIPWGAIKGAGNVYRHDYEKLDPNIIWETIVSGLPPLKKVIQEERTRARARGKHAREGGRKSAGRPTG